MSRYYKLCNKSMTMKLFSNSKFTRQEQLGFDEKDTN